ncbi:MAG: methylated-DNA--[protein]-cysteine S-methyltransferase [Desulfomonilaceae bacterium]|nr:methylated-DNA--[protein]-cysteine S-methyltransferase [Desulfomonilaceae bacterium]
MEQTDFVHHYFSPIVGSLELRVSDRGVRSISFIPRPTTPVTSVRNDVLEQLVHELDLYFFKKLRLFSVPPDPASGSAFQRRVWHELSRIPYGRTRSYAEVAEAVGNPLAARAVGSANRSNAIPIVIPCHRVIRSDGGLGGYGSGIRIKRKLLELEGVIV